MMKKKRKEKLPFSMRHPNVPLVISLVSLILVAIKAILPYMPQ